MSGERLWMKFGLETQLRWRESSTSSVSRNWRKARPPRSKRAVSAFHSGKISEHHQKAKDTRFAGMWCIAVLFHVLCRITEKRDSPEARSSRTRTSHHSHDHVGRW